jgi:hypothetical protein
VARSVRAFEADVLDELNVERLETVASFDQTAESLEGFPAGTDREVIVVLDTTLTPALQRKGLARQLVHQIQVMRKEAGLNVEDL